MKLVKSNIFIVALSFLSTVSIAGGINTVEVTINDENNSARGSTSIVRESRGTRQLLHCSLVTGIGGFRDEANCFATDSRRVTRSCTTQDPKLIETVRALTDSSFLEFRWTDAGDCLVILVSNGSPFGYRQR